MAEGGRQEYSVQISHRRTSKYYGKLYRWVHEGCPFQCFSEGEAIVTTILGGFGGGDKFF